MSTIPKDIAISELLLDFMPQKAKETFASSGAADELEGTEVSLLFEISDDKYSYIVKNGKDFDVQKGAVDNPMVRLSVEQDTFQKMMEADSLAMITELIFGLNKNRFNTITKLKGSFAAELANEDGSVFPLEVTFNGAAEPKAVFKLTTANSIALMAKETNPVNLFLSGNMVIEGDMPFAMATQPLFS